ncbi:MAG: uroporphyrinogen-III synthase [Caldimonas sp.]
MSEARRPRVIVTRPAAQASAAVRQLQARGVDALALPLIEIAALDDETALGEAWRSLPTRRLVVFVSVNAVLHFFAAQPGATGWPLDLLAAAPGPGTAAALHAAGIDPEAVIEPAADAAPLDSEALWQRLHDSDWRGASVLVVRGDGGRDWLAQQLAGAGAVVDAVTAYLRRAPRFDAAARSLLAAATLLPHDYVWLFSSSEAIGHLEMAAKGERWADSIAIATHPRIAARARQAGFGIVHEVRADLEGVVACIQSMRP